MTRALLVAGGGGVGKTTLSAGLGIAAAREGLETLVLTVDPARRLATALGIAHLGDEPLATPGVPRLAAAMLDAAASWEAIVRRHADPAVVERLLADPWFTAISRRFPAGQAYAAGDRLTDHIEARSWDLIVVDTPPAGGGIEFFAAPRSVRRLVGGRALRWLTGAGLPGRRRLYGVTARPVLRIADAVLGGPLLEEVAEFLLDLRTAYDGVSRRARRIEDHLRAAATIVVTTADPVPTAEALRFFRELPRSFDPPAAVVFNRALPQEWVGVDAGASLPTPIASNLQRWGQEARRQAEVQAEITGRAGVPPICVPWMSPPPSSIEALSSLIEAAGPRLAELWAL